MSYVDIHVMFVVIAAVIVIWRSFRMHGKHKLEITPIDEGIMIIVVLLFPYLVVWLYGKYLVNKARRWR